MSHSKRTQTGLTLIELLVAMGIAVIVSGVLVFMWLALTKSYTASARGSEAGELARDAVSRISREVRDAEPRDGYPAIRYFEALERVSAPSPGSPSVAAYIEFTTSFNQSDNDQPLPVPVLTTYEYRIAADGDQTLHRLRFDADGNEVRDDLVVTHLVNYVRDDSTGEYVVQHESPSLDANLPLRCFYIDGDTGRPVVAANSTHQKDLSLVTVDLLVRMPGGKSPRATNLSTTIKLRNQGL
jgi:Tfp pilus assembly protein PilW